MTTMNLPVLSDSFEYYMAQINRFDLLSPEEESQLARRYRQEGDLEAAHQLTCANLRFVVKVANEYRGYGLRMLDLVQEGNVGLMVAIKKFDPERGLRLITYAVWWIRAYMQNFIMRSWSLVKIGTTQAQKKLFFKLGQTRNALRNLTGEDDLQEVAELLDVDVSVVDSMSQRLGTRDVSLDVPLGDGEDFTLLDTLVDHSSNQEELLAEWQSQQQLSCQTRKALTTLKPRERQVIEQRVLSEEPRTLQELADDFGVSRERVRQIEQNALRKLRPLLDEEAGA
ncbi:MAG: RNA polymerase sigma factor RpoH [Desulfuromonas sp.]|nr:MAG: RNA polymerase sigma factor RpoH [Desulfuromonas sp.]